MFGRKTSDKYKEVLEYMTKYSDCLTDLQNNYYKGEKDDKAIRQKLNALLKMADNKNLLNEITKFNMGQEELKKLNSAVTFLYVRSFVVYRLTTLKNKSSDLKNYFAYLDKNNKKYSRNKQNVYLKSFIEWIATKDKSHADIYKAADAFSSDFKKLMNDTYTNLYQAVRKENSKLVLPYNFEMLLTKLAVPNVNEETKL